MVCSLSGYNNKYDTITNRVIRDYNHSVLVISVPSLITSKNSFTNSLNKLIKELTSDINEEVSAMDTSAGGYHLILNYRKISNLKKALVISPALSLNTDLLYKSIKKLNN